MHDILPPNQPPSPASVTLQVTRGYQEEMLIQSLHRNSIVAMDTGSGKTHIAVLRIKHEIEKQINKLCWFIAPTVALCIQQHAVLKKYIASKIGLINGANEPDQWKNPILWEKVLRTHQVVVSTPQVLLDALRHGYIVMGRDISLIVFDEAHHAKDNNPYNKIMQEFYFKLSTMRPMILGLTASPIFGGNIEKDLRVIEKNLDATISMPHQHRSELSQYVHHPTFTQVTYRLSNSQFSTNLASLKEVERQLDIEHDPHVSHLRNKLAKSPPDSAEFRTCDQRLSRVIKTKDTFTHKGLRDVINTADAIRSDVGEWAADWFVFKVVEHAKKAANPYSDFMGSWKHSEKAYLLTVLNRVALPPVSYHSDDIQGGCSDKVDVLIKRLLMELNEAQVSNEDYSGLIFVERRDVVLALTEVLRHHPRLQDAQFKVGMLLGTSDSSRRHSLMDITRHISRECQDDELDAFRDGELNIIVSTAVAEEGIDIQACGSVVRWDPPQNMKSWVQSRGRARKKKSTFTVMYVEGSKQLDGVKRMMEEERQMQELIYNQSRRAGIFGDEVVDGQDCDDDEDEDLEFEVPETGAKLTLYSAISHLTYFCAMIPNSSHVDNRPLFERDPPEFPEGWHSDRSQRLVPQSGPYGSTVTLPRPLPLPQRHFTVEKKFKNVTSAYRHAAFNAYKELYHHNLLNEHLLPIKSVVDPQLEEEVKAMLADIEKREGLANISLGIDPWVPIDGESSGWFCFELEIGDMAPLFLFTKSDVVPFDSDYGPTIFPPQRISMRISLREFTKVPHNHQIIVRARQFTRRIFWGLNASRMDWDNMDFAYLVLPVLESTTVWDSRRTWLEAENKANSERYPDRLNVKANLFVKKFGFVDDLNLIQRHGRPWKFSGWRHEMLSADEETKLRERYRKQLDDADDIIYPLIVVEPCTPRTNMLLPPSDPKVELKDTVKPSQYLIPVFTTIILLSKQESEYAFILPSVLRAISSLMTADSLQRTLFSTSPLKEIPLSLLTVAITTPSSNDGYNYQRLETLGDAALKFMVCFQLLGEYPLWHEGYLTRKKDHAVANVRLAKEDLKRKLYRWFICDVMQVRKWKPIYLSPKAVVSHRDDRRMSGGMIGAPAQEIGIMKVDGAEKQRRKKRKRKDNQQLSTKVLADVVESVIGAAYLHGGLSLAYEGIKYFDLGLEWKPISSRIEQILARADGITDNLASSMVTFPSQLEDVEHMLGYTFNQKVLLIEALTHASYQNDIPTSSYERMEFLGDSILDLIVNDYLYHAPGKNYSPGHIYLRKIAVVNMHFLAYICLNTGMESSAVMPMPDARTHRIVETSEKHEINLYKCLLHTSPRVLDDQRSTYYRFERLKVEISHALAEGTTYPWVALTKLQASKLFSDMIESLIGAVYLDSRGNMDAVRGVINQLGIMRILERIVVDDVDVLHPVSRLSLWAQKRGKELEYSIEKKGKDITCRVIVDGEELKGATTTTQGSRGKVSEEEVKFAAADAAIKVLKLRDGSMSGNQKKTNRKGRNLDMNM